jgi:hypothetical protein
MTHKTQEQLLNHIILTFEDVRFKPERMPISMWQLFSDHFKGLSSSLLLHPTIEIIQKKYSRVIIISCRGSDSNGKRYKIAHMTLMALVLEEHLKANDFDIIVQHYDKRREPVVYVNVDYMNELDMKRRVYKGYRSDAVEQIEF